MTFEQLKYFSKIVECGSINTAAKHCFISYTAMSKSLKNLEDELGLCLLNRNRNGISLTEDGEIFYNDITSILQMQEKWKKMASKKQQSPPKKLRVYATYFYTNYVFQDLTPTLRKNNYFLEYYPCLYEMIEPLLLNAADKSNTLAFTSRFLKQPSFEPFALAHGYSVHHLFTDGFLAYFNRSWFEQTYGKETTIIDAKELWHMSYVKDIAANNILPYFSLFNPDMPYYLTNIDIDIFPYLKKEKTFAFLNSSQKQKIEEANPHVKGVKIANAPLPLKIDYYFLYPSKIDQENYLLIELIKDYFAKNFAYNY